MREFIWLSNSIGEERRKWMRQAKDALKKGNKDCVVSFTPFMCLG